MASDLLMVAARPEAASHTGPMKGCFKGARREEQGPFSDEAARQQFREVRATRAGLTLAASRPMVWPRTEMLEGNTVAPSRPAVSLGT